MLRGTYFSSLDETDDPTVDAMVQLIRDGLVFRKEMFRGGLMGADLVRMKAKKQREKEVKEKHEKEISAESTRG